MQQAAPSNAPGEAPALATFDRRLGQVEEWFNLLAAFFIFGLMLLGIVQVLGRQLFNMPLSGYIDFVELSMAAFAFLGVAYCQRMGGHVRMEMALKALKGRPQWVLEAFGTLVGLGIVGVLVWYGYTHFLRAWQLGDSTIDAELPVWPSKLAVPLAFALLWLRLLVQLVGYLRLAIDPSRGPVAVPVLLTVEEQARMEIEESVDKVEKARGS
ncbi:MAG: TRAP transporter small permease [Proteobacteria bacterium]|nr:TRAP transporter small permease [Pseudomonadota bacterium]